LIAANLRTVEALYQIWLTLPPFLNIEAKKERYIEELDEIEKSHPVRVSLLRGFIPQIQLLVEQRAAQQQGEGAVFLAMFPLPPAYANLNVLNNHQQALQTS
jgi:hypothetical protein